MSSDSVRPNEKLRRVYPISMVSKLLTSDPPRTLCHDRYGDFKFGPRSSNLEKKTVKAHSALPVPGRMHGSLEYRNKGQSQLNISISISQSFAVYDGGAAQVSARLGDAIPRPVAWTISTTETNLSFQLRHRMPGVHRHPCERTKTVFFGWSNCSSRAFLALTLRFGST